MTQLITEITIDKRTLVNRSKCLSGGSYAWCAVRYVVFLLNQLTPTDKTNSQNVITSHNPKIKG